MNSFVSVEDEELNCETPDSFVVSSKVCCENKFVAEDSNLDINVNQSSAEVGKENLEESVLFCMSNNSSVNLGNNSHAVKDNSDFFPVTNIAATNEGGEASSLSDIAVDLECLPILMDCTNCVDLTSASESQTKVTENTDKLSEIESRQSPVDLFGSDDSCESFRGFSSKKSSLGPTLRENKIERHPTSNNLEINSRRRSLRDRLHLLSVRNKKEKSRQLKQNKHSTVSTPESRFSGTNSFTAKLRSKTCQNNSKNPLHSFCNTSTSKLKKETHASHRKFNKKSEKEKLIDLGNTPKAKITSTTKKKSLREENSFNMSDRISPFEFNEGTLSRSSSEESFEGFFSSDFKISEYYITKFKEDFNKELDEYFSETDSVDSTFKNDRKEIPNASKQQQAEDDDEFIGKYCSNVGCTVSWLESGDVKKCPITLNNGIVYELNEFAKKIAWESRYVIIWLLRLRGISTENVNDEDLKKVSSVIRRRKAICVNFYGRLVFKTKLESFEKELFDLSSEIEFESVNEQETSSIETETEKGEETLMNENESIDSPKMFIETEKGEETLMNENESIDSPKMFITESEPAETEIGLNTDENNQLKTNAAIEGTGTICNSSSVKISSKCVVLEDQRSDNHSPENELPKEIVAKDFATNSITGNSEKNSIIEAYQTPNVDLSKSMKNDSQIVQTNDVAKRNEEHLKLKNSSVQGPIKDDISIASKVENRDIIPNSSNYVVAETKTDDCQTEKEHPKTAATITDCSTISSCKNLHDSRTVTATTDGKETSDIVSLDDNIAENGGIVHPIPSNFMTPTKTLDDHSVVKDGTAGNIDKDQSLMEIHDVSSSSLDMQDTDLESDNIALLNKSMESDASISDQKEAKTCMKVQVKSLFKKQPLKKNYEHTETSMEITKKTEECAKSSTVPIKSGLMKLASPKDKSPSKQEKNLCSDPFGKSLKGRARKPTAKAQEFYVQKTLSGPTTPKEGLSAISVETQFEDDNSSIGKYCNYEHVTIKLLNSGLPLNKGRVTNGVVYDLYHFFKKRNAKLTTLVHTIYRLRNFKFEKSSIIPIMAKIHEMVKIKWNDLIEKDPTMPYENFNLDSLQKIKSQNSDHVTVGNNVNHSTERGKSVASKNIEKVVVVSNDAEKELEFGNQGQKDPCLINTRKRKSELIANIESPRKLRRQSRVEPHISDSLSSSTNNGSTPNSARSLATKSSSITSSSKGFDLNSTQGSEGKITRGDIVYMYTRWLKRKMEGQTKVFVTDLSLDVENLIEKRKIGSLRVPVGTLMSTSVNIFEEFRRLSKIDMDEAKGYLLNDWVEDIKLATQSNTTKATLQEDIQVKNIHDTSKSSIKEKTSSYPSDTISNDNKTSNEGKIIHSTEESAEIDANNDDITQPSKITPLQNNEEYDVEKIVGYRIVKIGDQSVTEYRVRWSGFSSQDDSWVNVTDLKCPEILADFWKALNKQRALKNATPSKETNAKVVPVKESKELSPLEKRHVQHPSKDIENRCPFFVLNEGNEEFFKLFAESLKPTLIDYHCEEDETSLTKRIKVSRREVLAIYDEWRLQNRQLLSNNSKSSINVDNLSSRVKELMDSKKVRNFNPSCLIDACYRMSLMKSKLLRNKTKLNEYLSGDFMELAETSKRHQIFVRKENEINFKKCKIEKINAHETEDPIDKMEEIYRIEREALHIAKVFEKSNASKNPNFLKNEISCLRKLKKFAETRPLPTFPPSTTLRTLKEQNLKTVIEIAKYGVSDEAIDDLFKIMLKRT